MVGTGGSGGAAASRELTVSRSKLRHLGLTELNFAHTSITYTVLFVALFERTGRFLMFPGFPCTTKEAFFSLEKVRKKDRGASFASFLVLLCAP